jgi:NitT/TauT family transport system substrate-binding protein
MKKIIISIISLLIALSLITSFITDKKDDNKIVVSEVTHSVFYAPWYVAIRNNYFKDENLNIEVMLTPGADKVATSVLSGDAQIGLSGPEATIYVYNNSKEKLITFASLTKRDGQFIVGDCKLKDTFTMNDLTNKKILAGRNAGMPLMMFKYALKESNIDEKKVNIDTSVEFAALSGAFIAKEGDFVNLFEPNASKIEKEGYGCVLASLGSITGIVPYTTFYSKEEYINNNKEIIQKFNNALNKGLEYVKNNDSKKIAEIILPEFPDISLNELTNLVDRYKKADSWYDTTFVNINDYNRLIDIMIYGKSINKKPPIEILITNEFNK